MRSLWLMYHDVYEAGRRYHPPRSAAMYHVTAERFESHLDAIEGSGLDTTTVGGFLSREVPTERSVVLTFDDGWRGSLEVALPRLLARGWRATFFITREFIGRDGFCDDAALRAAVDAGMEVGIHGTTHRMLSACSRDEIVEEFHACKQHLESVLGRPVPHASLPGGDVTPLVVACAREAAVESLCNSRPGINDSSTGLFDLKRVGIRSSTVANDIRRYCAFNLTRERIRWRCFNLPHTLLGMQRYSRLRRAILGERAGSRDEIFTP